MVRGAAVAAALVMVAGCKDAFSGHQNVVATAAGQELTVDRVAQMIAPAKSVPLRREIVDRIAEMWVDYQLLGQAIAKGDSLTDSATVEQANWPFVAQLMATAYHDSVVGTVRPTPAQVDSAYNGNDARLVHHIMVAVRPDTTDAVKAAKRRLAQGYLDQARGGADFAALASRVSEDTQSKPLGGSVGMITRGQMVKPFEDAAFALRPGEVTANLVETSYGYHVIWRPELARVRDSFTVDLERLIGDRADSIFLDSLTNKSGISVVSRAPAIVKSVALNLRVSKTRSRTLASWRGGELSEKEFARWLEAYPPQTLGQIGGAPDSTLVEFVKSIARNEMIIDAARRRNITMTAAARDSLRTRYAADLATMLTGMGVAAESLANDTTQNSTREAIAARRVNAYFAAITSQPGARQMYMVPPFLAEVLRTRASWKINAAGVDQALERARTLRGPEVPTAGGPLPNMQQAPGGPPMPGQPGGPPARSIR
jgi:hypothetical protein